MKMEQRMMKKCLEAQARQEARNKITPQGQLEKLDLTLGIGVGAKKERARLMKEIGK